MKVAGVEYTSDDIAYLYEIRGVYDGWSILVLKDGTLLNRWANEAGDGPEPGYESRYAKTQSHLAAIILDREERRPAD